MCKHSLLTWQPTLSSRSTQVHVTLPDYYSPEHLGMIVPKTKDGRVVFMLPWQSATIAGTTGKALMALCMRGSSCSWLCALRTVWPLLTLVFDQLGVCDAAVPVSLLQEPALLSVHLLSCAQTPAVLQTAAQR